MPALFADNLIVVLGAGFLVGMLLVFLFAKWHRVRTEEQRRAELVHVSLDLGLNLRTAKDFGIPSRYEFLQQPPRGDNRHARNILEGEFRGQRVCIFEFHFNLTPFLHLGFEKRHPQQLSVFALETSRGFPPLRISSDPIPWFPALPGSDEIRLDDDPFFLRFHVRSLDRRFAAELLHPAMKACLSANSNLHLEFGANRMALVVRRRLQPEEIRPNLERLIEVHALTPNQC